MEIVTTSCVYLHNFLRMSAASRTLYSPHGSFDTYSQDGSIIQGAWRTETIGDTGMINLRHIPRRPPTEAKEVREEFKQYFEPHAGEVPWQYLYA